MEPKDLPGEITKMKDTLSQIKTEMGREFRLVEERLEALQLAQTAQEPPTPGTNGSEKADLHSHTTCPDCLAMVTGSRDMARKELLAVPGVKEAVEYHQVMAKMGYQGQSWYTVPQVASAVQMHQLMLTPVETQVGT